MPTRDATASGARTAPPGADESDLAWIRERENKLSPTTLRAKWIHAPGDEADRDGQTLATRANDVIRDWAERRGATPATATRGEEDGRPRTLRFVFGKGDARGGKTRLERIGWDEWLDVFQRRELVFLFQERRKDGSTSNFFRLDSPQREDG